MGNRRLYDKEICLYYLPLSVFCYSRMLENSLIVCDKNELVVSSQIAYIEHTAMTTDED